MLKYGINILFAIFTQLIFYITFIDLSYGAVNGLVVIIFLVEFIIAGYIINLGYQEVNKQDSEE